MTDLNFRKCGFTDNAINFPLSDNGKAFVAHMNGVPVNSMPKEWGYSPNEAVRRRTEALGQRLAAGLPVTDEAGRYLLLRECDVVMSD